MDSTAPHGVQPAILFVVTDANLRELIARPLGQVGYDAVLAASGSGEADLDPISAVDFDGLDCEVQLPGEVDSWEVGATFSFVWPDKPTVYAFASVSGPPGHRATGAAAEGHFPAQALRPGPARHGFRDQRSRRAGKAGAGMIDQETKNFASMRIKPASSSVHLT
ncbi:hypothetical protein [Microvirga sp. BSC39]|uniref:hypothetical protein n=1 Tax=Microvirga sp. BSC39 TaxID=1549810 RepID=UPI0012698A72|nr:hypothetical protein [Microvirga sp. BSC39]